MRRIIWSLFLLSGIIASLLDGIKIYAKSHLSSETNDKNQVREGHDFIYFTDSNNQMDEFNHLLAAHRSHRSHSSHRSHYSGRYSSPIISTPRSYRTPSFSSPKSSSSSSSRSSSGKRSFIPATVVAAPQVFQSWKTTNYDSTKTEDICANSGNFSWCVSKDAISSEPKAAASNKVMDVSLYALLKVTFPKGDVNFTKNTRLWYSVDDKKPVACTITDITHEDSSTLVFFSPPDISDFESACKKGNNIKFIAKDKGKEQSEDYSLSGFTAAKSFILKQIESSLKEASYYP